MLHCICLNYIYIQNFKCHKIERHKCFLTRIVSICFVEWPGFSLHLKEMFVWVFIYSHVQNECKGTFYTSPQHLKKQPFWFSNLLFLGHIFLIYVVIKKSCFVQCNGLISVWLWFSGLKSTTSTRRCSRLDVWDNNRKSKGGLQEMVSSRCFAVRWLPEYQDTLFSQICTNFFSANSTFLYLTIIKMFQKCWSTQLKVISETFIMDNISMKNRSVWVQVYLLCFVQWATHKHPTDWQDVLQCQSSTRHYGDKNNEQNHK